MISPARVLHTEDLRLRLVLAFAAGLAIAGLAFAVTHTGEDAPAEFASPEIVKQDDNVTVARIPARRGEVMAACVLFIDYQRRTWALSC